MPITAKAVFLKAYPEGSPSPDLFEVRDVVVPDPQDGQVLLRTVWMSVDPYMRGRMNPHIKSCLLYTSPSPRDLSTSRMPSSA